MKMKNIIGIYIISIVTKKEETFIKHLFNSNSHHNNKK